MNFTISLYTQPVADITGPSFICYGVNYDFTAADAGTGSTTIYTWDFGDGSPPESGTTTDPYVIEAIHTYTGSEGTPFTATITITDADGNTASDTYPLIIRPLTLETEVNVAIAEFLTELA